MKGHVQIFDGDVLLHEDHNMIVDGAGEHIVDILTLSPDIGTDSNGDTINANQKAKDYRIEYASLGKSQKGYEENLHKYRQHNLIASGNHFEGLGTEVDITPVIGYHSIDTGGKAFKVTSLSNDGGYIEWTSRLNADFMAKLKKCPLVFSIDFKLDPNSQGSLLTGSAYGKQLSNRHLFSVLIESGTEKFEYTLSLQKPSEPTAGEVIGGVDDVLAGEVCYKRLGHGWHRMCATLPVKINGLAGGTYSGNRSSDEFKIKLYPSYSKDLDPSDVGNDSTPDLTQGASLVGSMFLARPSLNVGSLPINYYKGEERVTNEVADNGRGYPKLWRTVANVAMTDDDCPYLEDLPGTLTNNSTSYNVIAELTDNPTPEDTRLQTSSITSYEKSTDVVVNQGHNICVSKKLFLNGQDAKDFIRDIVDNAWQFSDDYTEMGVQPDLRWFGCFADKWYVNYSDTHFSKIEKGDKIYNFPQSPSLVDAMDVYGYIGRNDENNSKFRCVLTGNEATDPTLGKVVFTITIPAKDKKALNAFGGVFELGLSVANLTETYKKQQKTLGQSVNLSVAQVDVIRRLFCKKSFNFDITAGDKTLNFNEPNSVTDLVINWVLDFGGTLQLS